MKAAIRFALWPALAAAIGSGVLASTPVYAQSTDESGFEISLTYGRNQDPISFVEQFAAGLRLAGLREIRIDGRPDTQPDLGVTAGGTVGRYVLVSSEFMYNDLGQAQVSARVPFVATRTNFTVRMRLFEWTSGARVLFPTGAWRVRPYVGGGLGNAWAHISGEAQGVSSQSTSTRDLIYHGDVGARVFLTRHVGIAPEFRYVKLPDWSFYRVLVSAVFRAD
jgi:hypothetical protein